jgi:hypothetical protein
MSFCTKHIYEGLDCPVCKCVKLEAKFERLKGELKTAINAIIPDEDKVTLVEALKPNGWKEKAELWDWLSENVIQSDNNKRRAVLTKHGWFYGDTLESAVKAAKEVKG